ncbi:MAG: DUF4384 domain-containing protein, partial [Planctomycetaceae bacterium]|nr:DUF4384 domain-containing protein [Planctomycetaceae bacterium]
MTFLLVGPVWAEEFLFNLDAALTPLSIQQTDANVVFQGRADKTPWAGYSFPIDKGGLQKPLTVYDKYTTKKAEAWEKQNRKVPKTYNAAWAASSILEPEPTGKDSKMIEIRKGLLAGIYDSDKTIKIEGGDTTTNKCTPKSLWRALHNNISRLKTPVVVCFNGADEDDNHAIYAYNITCTPTKGTDLWDGEFVLLSIVDIENPSENPIRKTTLKFNGKIKDRIFVDDGQWIGELIPSYVWTASSPGDKIRNEEIIVPEVRKILALPDEELDKYLSVSLSDENNEVEKIYDPGKLPERKDGDFKIVPKIPAKVNNDKEQTTKLPITPSKPKPEPSKHELKTAVYLSVDEMLALLANKISSWTFDASIPKKLDGGVMNAGDNFKVAVKSEQSGYLYIIAVNREGDISMIYPVPGEDNYYSARSQSVLLPRDDRYFQIAENLPIGEVRLKVFLTGLPVHISGAGNFEKILLRKSNDQNESTDLPTLFSDDDELESTGFIGFITRRLRMARQQRRYVKNSVKNYPKDGLVTSPVMEPPKPVEPNPEPSPFIEQQNQKTQQNQVPESQGSVMEPPKPVEPNPEPNPFIEQQ